MKMRSATGGLAAAVIFSGGVLFAMAQQPELEELLVVSRSEVPAVEVIAWGEKAHGLAKFDTRTGAVWRYNGDVLRQNTTGQWVLEVAPIAERPIGTFRLQHANTAGLFLIDAVTGETWLLRERATDNFSWEPVRDFARVLTSRGG